MDFVVAIPSYSRPIQLRDKTLNFLSVSGVPADIITVFVATESERQIYSENLIAGTYKEIVVGVPTISAQRSFIRNYYPEGTKVLSVDDDIKKIKMLNPRPLIPIINQLFKWCEEENITTWGIYPVNNLFYCKERAITGLSYIVACFYGFINKNDTEYPPWYCKEDKWYSIHRYLKDGATLRYEGMCPDTTYYGRGGLSCYRTLVLEKEHTEQIVALFPNIAKYQLKKNGHSEVSFKTIKTKTLFMV